ncbi:YlcG family protein [Buttiauxella sp. 3AFRM03]|nr:YlcG family protein [Buttiauxella sp. 3AFRM03]AYN29988.1 YlcG family protein [Buttiauxella sp. 3AFRM03]
MTHPVIILELRRRWLALRCFRSAGSVLVDYRIIQNYAKRLIAGTAK